jgi:pimeloyl-ACP methyl ester carboxylesterase
MYETVPGIYWQWQQHSIHYIQAGSRDNPNLLLVHGFGASTDHWCKNITDLSQDFCVWAIDLLGFGRSTKANLIYTANLWQQQLKDFIDQVIGQPTYIAGNSLGGYCALALAANHPEVICGVVLLNPAGAFSTPATTQETTNIQNFGQIISQAMRWLILHPWINFLVFQYVRQKSVIRQTLEKVYLDKTAITDQLVEAIYRPSCDLGAAQVFANIFKNPQGEKIDELLKKLDRPLLGLWGEADPWMNAVSRSEKFRQFYPNIKEYYLNAGHCPHDEVPQQVNYLIKTWIQETRID